MSLRAYHPGPLPPPGGEITLDTGEARHLARVRRVRAGEPVSVLDGRGGVATGELADVGADTVVVRVAKLEHHAAPPQRLLTVGLPKGGVFEDIIRTATELGATAVQPLLAARCEVRLDDDLERVARKTARWRAAAIEAGKQSGNPWFPEIHAPLAPSAWLAGLAAGDALKLVAALTPAARPLREILGGENKSGIGADSSSFRFGNQHSVFSISCFLAVGPEGDFTPEEYAQFSAAGFHALRLPGHVLRVETACAAALALLG